MNLDDLLTKTVDQDGSDLHLTAGSSPRIRKSGSLVPLDNEILNPQTIKSLLEPKLSTEQLAKIESGNELDYSISVPGLSRFRVNVFKQRGNLSAAFRRLPYEIPKIETLGLPEQIIKLSEKRRGLLLITGATGSGKSTTMAALIEKIANELDGHILTIEDPIEYLYKHGKAQINQREVGVDTASFASGLRSALRQDPDIVVVGELRDMESMASAMTIAETGHLVLATLHSNTAASTLNRLVDAFPPDKKDIIRMNISMSLLAIISQQLIPTIDKKRSLACEILIANPAIRALIREDNIHQIDNYIKSGTQEGMIRMDDSLIELYKSNIISYDDALKYAIDQKQVSQTIGVKPKQPNL